LRKHSGEDLPDESNINPADLAEEFLLDQALQTPEGLRWRDDRQVFTLAQDARELVSNIYSEYARFCEGNGYKGMNEAHLAVTSDSYSHKLNG